MSDSDTPVAPPVDADTLPEPGSQDEAAALEASQLPNDDDANAVDQPQTPGSDPILDHIHPDENPNATGTEA